MHMETNQYSPMDRPNNHARSLEYSNFNRQYRRPTYQPFSQIYRHNVQYVRPAYHPQSSFGYHQYSSPVYGRPLRFYKYVLTVLAVRFNIQTNLSVPPHPQIVKVIDIRPLVILIIGQSIPRQPSATINILLLITNTQLMII